MINEILQWCTIGIGLLILLVLFKWQKDGQEKAMDCLESINSHLRRPPLESFLPPDMRKHR